MDETPALATLGQTSQLIDLVQNHASFGQQALKRGISQLFWACGLIFPPMAILEWKWTWSSGHLRKFLCVFLNMYDTADQLGLPDSNSLLRLDNFRAQTKEKIEKKMNDNSITHCVIPGGFITNPLMALLISLAGRYWKNGGLKSFMNLSLNLLTRQQNQKHF